MKKRWMSRLLLPVVVLSFVTVAPGEEGGLRPLRATIQASEDFTPTGQPGLGRI
jgi:hypothetical protein